MVCDYVSGTKVIQTTQKFNKFTFIRTYHSKMANSFLGTRSVELKQSILTKNDKCKICRGCLGLFKFAKRERQKGGQPSLGTDEQWVQPQKSGTFRIFYPGGSNMKGGHPIEHKKGGRKGGATFPNIGSD